MSKEQIKSNIMNVDQKLLEAAIKLCGLMDKAADKALPKEISNIVKLHSKMAVGSAWVPVPGADIAAGAAVIWGMYIRINSKLKMPFKDNVMKSIGSGVATNLTSYLACAGLGSMIKLIPGIGTIGGAVIMSAGLYAATLASGYIYLQALISLKEKKIAVNDQSIKGAVDEILKEKSFIKDFIKSAKQSYK